jgi:hypothetical protein
MASGWHAGLKRGKGDALLLAFMFRLSLSGPPWAGQVFQTAVACSDRAGWRLMAISICGTFTSLRPGSATRNRAASKEIHQFDEYYGSHPTLIFVLLLLNVRLARRNLWRLSIPKDTVEVSTGGWVHVAHECETTFRRR